ncbi:restriction endonuclease subunit S, partial [Thermococci archaeon]
YITNNKRKLKYLAQGSTIKGILKKELGRLKIPLPPLPEQKKIAEILSTVDKKLELERERKKKLERIKRGLMNDLLTGKRRVKVDAIH